MGYQFGQGNPGYDSRPLARREVQTGSIRPPRQTVVRVEEAETDALLTPVVDAHQAELDLRR